MCGKRWRFWLLCAFFLAALLPSPSWADPLSPESSERLRANLLEARELLKTWGDSLTMRESEMIERESFLSRIEQRLNEREETLLQSEVALLSKELTLAEKELILSERERLLQESESDYQRSVQLIADLKASLGIAYSSLDSVMGQVSVLELKVKFWQKAGIGSVAVAVLSVLFALIK
jgi:hypothetical protein